MVLKLQPPGFLHMYTQAPSFWPIWRRNSNSNPLWKEKTKMAPWTCRQGTRALVRVPTVWNSAHPRGRRTNRKQCFCTVVTLFVHCRRLLPTHARESTVAREFLLSPRSGHADERRSGDSVRVGHDRGHVSPAGASMMSFFFNSLAGELFRLATAPFQPITPQGPALVVL